MHTCSYSYGLAEILFCNVVCPEKYQGLRSMEVYVKATVNVHWLERGFLYSRVARI